MERLTTNKNVSEMGMYELALNSCYIHDGLTRYRDFERDVDARDFARELMVAFDEWKKDGADTDNEIVGDDVFDDTIFDNLAYEPNTITGLIALFYRNLWVMAELREKLKQYEDAEEQGLLLKLPCKVGDKVFVLTGLEDDNIVHEGKCVGYTKNELRGWLIEVNYFGGYKSFESFAEIGKSVFLTKEEAEQKLK